MIPQARFVMIGDGELRDSLQKLALRLGIGDHILFAGYRADATHLLAACDCLALPSLWEGLSYVMLESMVSAVPIIVTDIPAFSVVEPDITGLVVPPRDPLALSGAINRLLTDPSLAARLGANARSMVLARYNLAEQIGRVERLYDEVASRERP
jgi:glycosyltransferase involved in cell wall biosynthesis